MSVRLYELFARLSFDELVPTLRTICESDPRKITSQLPHFKMAFDELRMIEPEINNNTIDVDSAESFVCVEGCQDHWNIVLGKIINPESGVTLSDSELAAHILWEITFFGYSEDEMMESMGQEYGDKTPSHDNIYRRKIQEIEDRQWRNYSRGANDLFEILDRQKRRNRAKRMRDARQNRQIAKLQKLARREDIICQAVASECFYREEIEHILKASSGEEHTYLTKTPSVEGRAEYLTELLSKYSEIDFTEYDSTIVIITYSPDYPITTEEKAYISGYFSQIPFLKNRTIRFGEDKSTLNHHLKMQLILTRCQF